MPLAPVLACLAALWTGQAAAHPGHLAEAAGHAHWGALAAALGAAAAAALIRRARKRRSDEAQAQGDEAEA